MRLTRKSVLAIIAAVSWGVFAWGLVPRIIGAAYRGESLDLLNRVISGQATNPLERYLASWNRLAVTLSLAALLLVGILAAGRRWGLHARLGDWWAGFQERERALKAEPPTVRAADLFALVIWCGGVTGLVEGLYLSKRMVLGEWIPVHMATSPHAIWMAPLAYLAVFAPLGLLAISLLKRGRDVEVLRAALFIAISLGFFSLSRATAFRLEVYGALPLAMGLGLLVSRVMFVNWTRLAKVARRSLVIAATLLAVAGVTIEGVGRVREARELAALPPPGAEPTNLLFIILDTVRAKSLGLYGHTRETTPQLERFAEKGIVFDRAVASSPWTLPTHATLFTGRHHHELSVNWRVPLDERFPTLAELLRAEGYATAGFVGNFYYAGPRFGLDRGFIRYRHKPVTLGAIVTSGWLAREMWVGLRRAIGVRQDAVRKTAEDINIDFLDWLDGVDDGRPFFAFLNYFDAHSPYLPPEPFDRHFTEHSPRYWLDDEGAEYTDEDLEDLRAAYDNSIAYLDDRLGALFTALEQRQKLDGTLVIITSDHGEQFGEHGLMYHSNGLYMPLLHVPLVLVLPRVIPGGERVTDAVSVRDLGATALELLDVDRGTFPGTSLSSFWGASDPGPGGRRDILSRVTRNDRIPAWMPAAYGPMSSIVSDEFHYIRRGDGAEELYDWFSDPDELRDLSADPEARAQLEQMRRRLDEVLQGPRVDPSPPPPGSPPPESSR